MCACVCDIPGRAGYIWGVTTTTTVPLRFGRPLASWGIYNNKQYYSAANTPTRQPIPTPSRRLLMTTYM